MAKIIELLRRIVTVGENEAKDSLERSLLGFKENPVETNITVEDIRKHHRRTIRNEAVKNSDIHYIFFLPEADGITFSIGQNSSFLVKLRPNNYGFGSERVNICPTELNLNLSNGPKRIYEELIAQRNLGVNDLLESVGGIINDSTRWILEESFEKLLNKVRKNPIHVYNIFDVLAASKYVPRGDETMRGDCRYAGRLIRTVLHSMNAEGLRYVHAPTVIGKVGHDTTVVFDINDGRWAVINSKSARIKHNLIPPEFISKMGHSYYKFKTR